MTKSPAAHHFFLKKSRFSIIRYRFRLSFFLNSAVLIHNGNLPESEDESAGFLQKRVAKTPVAC